MEDENHTINRIEQILGRSILKEKNNIKSFSEVTEADLNDFREVLKEGGNVYAISYILYRIEGVRLNEAVEYFCSTVNQVNS